MCLVYYYLFNLKFVRCKCPHIQCLGEEYARETIDKLLEFY